GVGQLQPGDDAQERRLARARRAQEGHQAAGRHLDTHVVQGGKLPVPLRHALDRDAHALASASPGPLTPPVRPSASSWGVFFSSTTFKINATSARSVSTGATAEAPA